MSGEKTVLIRAFSKAIAIERVTRKCYNYEKGWDKTENYDFYRFQYRMKVEEQYERLPGTYKRT